MRFLPILLRLEARSRNSVFALLLVSPLYCQSNRGELQLKVTDPSGHGVQSTINVKSEANQYHSMLKSSAQGDLELQRLPFGIYELEIAEPGFGPVAESINIRGSLPI